MQLWLAQALYASNVGDQRDRAVTMLGALERHPSGDVRRVAKEVKYIYEAPALAIDDSQRVSFRSLENLEDESPWQRGPDGKVYNRKKNIPKEPAYMSDEWLEREVQRGSGAVVMDPAPIIVACGICLGTLFFFR